MNSLVWKALAYVTDAEGDVCVFVCLFLCFILLAENSLREGERKKFICRRSCYHVQVHVSLRSSRFRFLWAKGGKNERRESIGQNGTKKVGAGAGAGKERKRLPLSPDILPNAPKWLRSLGAYAVTSNVTREQIIFNFW